MFSFRQKELLDHGTLSFIQRKSMNTSKSPLELSLTLDDLKNYGLKAPGSYRMYILVFYLFGAGFVRFLFQTFNLQDLVLL